jgi:hypothetical protein
MNYDNLHTTAEILEAFQGCRDAGEEIDLFEALAWRDKPPWEAFIEILRRIKLEPVLTLAIQALGWVKNEEVKERLKKSDDLLILLSNLAKSGETDLIRWSAAKSIIAIGFNFINVSQHLTETPSEIIQNLLDKYSKGSSLENSPNNFWVYGDIAYFCSIANGFSLQKTTEVLDRKGIRGIIEINSLLKKLLKNGTVDVFNCTMAGQQLSRKRLLDLTTSTQQECYRILLSNQIYCVNSHHLEIKRAAIGFLCDVENEIMTPQNPLELKQEIDKIRDIAREVENLAKGIDVNWSHIFLNDLKQINHKIKDDFDKTCQAAETIFSNKSSIEVGNHSNKSNELSRELTAKRLSIDKLKNDLELANNRIYSQKKEFVGQIFGCFFSILVMDWFLLIGLGLTIGSFYGGYLAIFIIVLIDIIYVMFVVASHLHALSTITSEKRTLNERKNSLEFERSEVTQRIQELGARKENEIRQAKDERDSKNRQAETNKNERIATLKKIEDLLREREKIHELIN